MCVPTESYQFSVPESVLVSSVVAKIKALDLDVGSNAEMDYRILDGDGLGTFRVITDPNTQEGLVTLHKVLVVFVSFLHPEVKTLTLIQRILTPLRTSAAVNSLPV